MSRPPVPFGLEVIPAIRLTFVRGEGVAMDPMREVTRLYDLDGALMAELDPVNTTDLQPALADLRRWYDDPDRPGIEAGQPLAGIIRRLVGKPYPGDR